MSNQNLDIDKEMFFNMLNSDYCEECDDTNTCLISGEPLKIHSVTLNCNHKFNYFELYNEVIKQKQKFNHLEIVNLKINEIKCPYCRIITPNLLPYLEINGVEKIKGVNFPPKYCMSLFKCQYKFKSGKKKNCLCNKDSWKFDNGWFCMNHIKYCNTNKLQLDNELDKNHFLDYLDNTTLISLKAQLIENKLPKSGTKKILIERLLKNGIEININNK